jgi:hypothetical protein
MYADGGRKMGLGGDGCPLHLMARQRVTETASHVIPAARYGCLIGSATQDHADSLREDIDVYYKHMYVVYSVANTHSRESTPYTKCPEESQVSYECYKFHLRLLTNCSSVNPRRSWYVVQCWNL